MRIRRRKPKAGKSCYRMATPEEKEKLTALGRCWLVRDYGDGSVMFCPHDQAKGYEFCVYHEKLGVRDAEDEVETEEVKADAVADV